MKLIELTHQAPWDAFQTSRPFAQFPQSWAWGEFRASHGCPLRRFLLLDDRGDVAVAAQMEYRRRKFGTGYWFAPRGPVFSPKLPPDGRRDAMMRFCEQLLKISGDHKGSPLRRRTLFWRMEPVSELGNPEGLVPLSFRRTPALNPASTILLDLAPSEDDLFRRMSEKTRYNIRVAEKHGVTSRVGSGAKDLDAFLRLMGETAARDRFIQHDAAYLAATYEFLAARGMARLRFAEHDGKVLAANMEIAFGDTVTYLYGASSSESRNVMAPHHLHWSAIRDAKAKGFSIYDFWGANPEWKGMHSYKPSWEGITRFKRGFGGRLVNFVGTWDLPFHPFLYLLTHPKNFFRE